MEIIRNKFDFDVGYLIESPCKHCRDRNLFPTCIDKCDVLDKIQKILAQGISCSRSPSNLESYAVFHQESKRIQTERG